MKLHSTQNQCSHCGVVYDKAFDNPTVPNHCPGCAARVMSGQAEAAPVEFHEGDRVATVKRNMAQRRKAEYRKAAKRRLWRESLIDFVVAYGGQGSEPWQETWMFDDLCEHLMDVSRAVAKEDADVPPPRLLISMPPGHGKSTVASQRFPAWHLGRNPAHDIVITSHSKDLARRQSEQMQFVVQDGIYQDAFPDAKIDAKRKSSADNWRLLRFGRWEGRKRIRDGGGEIYAVGTGGSLTGRRSNLIIVDDAFSGPEEASSQTQREKVWTWFTNVVLTRGHDSHLGIIVIGTRWHEDDLIGRIIEHERSELETYRKGALTHEPIPWQKIKYKAIATEDEPHRKKGEALFPQRFPLPTLLAQKSIMSKRGPREWECVYQQSPFLTENAMFDVNTFPRYDPSEIQSWDLVCWAAWDLAIAGSDDSDYSVGSVLGKDSDDDVYLLEVIRGKWSTHELVDRMLSTHAKWDCTTTGIESGMLEMAIMPVLSSEKRRRRMLACNFEPISTKNRSKELRAQPFATLGAGGHFWLPENGTELWVEDFVQEMVRFPFGRHDDQVDSVSHAVSLYNRIVKPRKPSKAADAAQKLIANLRRPKQTVNANATSHRIGMSA